MNEPDPILRAIVGIYCALFLLPVIPLIVSWFHTKQREQGRQRARPYLNTLGWILRFAVVINIVLALLMLMPESSFLGQLPDHLWGNFRLYGWRADVVWVCASTPFLVIASIPFIVVGGVTKTKERRFHNTAILSLVWLVFLPFLIHFAPRLREMGIRLALGARPAQIVALVIRAVALLTLIGRSGFPLCIEDHVPALS